MPFAQFRASRRPLVIVVALVALISLAIGAHAAFNKRTDKATAAAETVAAARPSRVALVIGNSRYPDAGAPLVQPVNDIRALSATLRRDGFDVEAVEDGRRDDITRAVERLKSKINPDTVVMLYFGGFGIQAGRESYMIPVDAAIWRESDVRRQGVSVEGVLNAISERGAHAKLVVIDASRRNPYERRFRGFSHGLAPIGAPGNALILTSATPGKVADDSSGPHSVLMSELLANLDAKAASAESVFSNVRNAISRASDGQQVPLISSSLIEDVSFGAAVEASAAKAGS
jgi:uncharacterized caspase-like protein